MIPELTIVVPTLNERDNIEPLVARLRRVLDGVVWDVVFVDDDSRDGTLEALHSLARQDERIRYIQRIGRSGLSSACLEGMAASSAPYLAVIDADLQHDEALLPRMLETLKQGGTDLVVGSRYLEGGGVGGWSKTRRWLSRFSTVLSRLVLRTQLSDPLSGYFMLTRELRDRALRKVSGRGFKILLDLVASVDGPVRAVELPYTFGLRQAGESKLDTLVAYEFALVLAHKLFGRVVPVRFVMFVAVGALGAVVHLGLLGYFFLIVGTPFLLAQTVAAIAAMTLNYSVNNVFTYRDNRLAGRDYVTGLALFFVICSVGAFANIRIAEYLFENGIPWWGAGLLGATLGAVWNYAVSSTFVWSRRRV